MKKTLRAAALLTAFVLAGGLPLTMADGAFSAKPLTVYADESYTYGSTNSFEYKKYSDHIEITSAKSANADSVEIPASIDNLPVTTIGIYAFQFNSMKTLTLPDTLTEIGFYTFGYCKNLTSVTIPDSVRKIGLHAFEECTSLTTINFPDHLVETMDYTFENTPWLKEQRQKDPLVIVNGAVIDGRTCEGDVVVPSSVKYVASGAFAKNDKLTSVVFPASVTAIADNTFWYCGNLKSAELKGAETLGFGVFAACNKLTDLKLSGNLKSIDGYTFADNTASATITFYGSESTWNSVEKPSNDQFLQRAKYIFDENHTEPEEGMKGDANCDNQVDMGDVVLIMQSISNPNKYGENGTDDSHLTAKGRINGDMNGDGLTVGDAQAIQKILLGVN